MQFCFFFFLDLQSHNRLILFPTVKNFSINHLLYSTSDYKCESSDDCADFIQGSICQQESCVCPKPLLLSRDKTKCLKPAIEFGSQCEDDIQCSETLLSGGVCLGNVCKCKTGYHYLKGTCWKSQKLKEKCIRNEQCFSNYDYRGQECKEKICTCRPDYYNRLNSGCRKARNLGESCNIDSDCPGESTCEKMKCAKAQMKINKKPPFVFELNDSIPDTEGENLTCPKGSYNLNGKCVLELGMTCTTDSNCTHIAKASCLDNVCSCEPVLAIANENNRKCLQGEQK